MEIKIEPTYWIMYGGHTLILPNWFVEKATDFKYLKHKKGSKNNEVEFVSNHLI